MPLPQERAAVSVAGETARRRRAPRAVTSFAVRRLEFAPDARRGSPETIADELADRHGISYEDPEQLLPFSAKGRHAKELREMPGRSDVKEDRFVAERGPRGRAPRTLGARAPAGLRAPAAQRAPSRVALPRRPRTSPRRARRLLGRDRPQLNQLCATAHD